MPRVKSLFVEVVPNLCHAIAFFFIRIQIANANATNVLNILESISSLLLLLFIQKTETHFSNSKQKPIIKKKPKIPPNFSDVADFSYVLYD